MQAVPVIVLAVVQTVSLIVAIAAFRVDDAWRTLPLRHEVALAQVEATRTEYQGTDAVHWARYRFDVDGRSFTHCSAWGACDRWAEIAPSDWELARDMAFLRVAHLPNRPRVNLPASQLAAVIVSPWGLVIVGVAGAIFIACVGLWFLFVHQRGLAVIDSRARKARRRLFWRTEA